jgi:hypothetical protein
MVVALLALFVALDGPATAARLIDGGSIRKNSITSAQIHNGTLGTQDLSRTAIRTLQATPAAAVRAEQIAPKAVDATKLADGAIGPVQLAPDAVTSSRIADGAVGGAAIADGSLQANDIGDVYGSVVIDFDPFRLNECQKAEVTPTPAGANTSATIADDIVLVTPQAGFSDLLTVYGNPGVGPGGTSVLRIIACRVGNPVPPPSPDMPIDPPPTQFNYVGIDLP